MSEISANAADKRRTLIDNLRTRERDLTFSQACDLNAAELPDGIALVDRTSRLTWLCLMRSSLRRFSSAG